MSERFKFSYIVYGNIVQHEQHKYNDNIHCVVLTRLAVGVRVDGEDVAQLELEIELVRNRQLRFSGDPFENSSPLL